MAPTSLVAVIDAEGVAPNEVLGELPKERELDLKRDLVLFFSFLFFGAPLYIMMGLCYELLP